jgi:hypothetical protein
MNSRLRFCLVAIFLTASILACTLPQTSPTPPASTDTPFPTASPTPDIETVDEFFARCPSAEEVAKVNSDLTVSFEYDPTAGTLVCTAATGSADLTALQKRAYQTIYVMRLLHFSQPLPWTDKQLYDWLVNAIDGISFIDGGGSGYSYCCAPEGTIVIALNPNAIILATDQWMQPSLSSGLMNTMFLYAHEARHNEGYGHTCVNPDRNGDDNLVTEMGSWSIQYYLALWIAQYGERSFLMASGADPNVYRQMALQDAQTTREVRFCEDPAPTPGPTLIP